MGRVSQKPCISCATVFDPKHTSTPGASDSRITIQAGQRASTTDVINNRDAVVPHNISEVDRVTISERWRTA